MITLSKFAEIIENGLNSNEQGLNFKIFTDAGKYKKALKTRTVKKKYTNGILRIGTSSIVPVKGITIATQGATLEFCVSLPTPETDDKIITAHRAVFDTYFSAFSVQSITENGKSYAVSSTYSLANTGTVEIREGVGTSITFYVNISYSYIENGLNSNDCIYTLDGEEIPFTSVHERKFPTTDANASNGETGVSYCRNSSFMRGWDFEMPALDGVAISDNIIEQIDNNDSNITHTLIRTMGANTKTYSVIFGNVAMNVQGVTNIGLTFSLVERAPYARGETNG